MLMNTAGLHGCGSATLTARIDARPAVHQSGMKSTFWQPVPILLVLLSFSACDRSPSASYMPGLGEIMALQQMRHSKLWFAGQAANWDLAAYELDELEEGFAEAVLYHPSHKLSPDPLTRAIPTFTDRPMKELRDSVKAEDLARFEHAFDALTLACNVCHGATSFAFNIVGRPQQNPFTNQVFSLPK